MVLRLKGNKEKKDHKINPIFAQIIFEMALLNQMIAELKHEAANTHKILERVPEDQWDWKPHEKSFTLGKLACHVAELPGWVNHIVTGSSFDIVQDRFERLTVRTKKELLEAAEKNIQQAVAALEKVKDEDLNTVWTFKRGGVTVFELPRKVALRNMVLSHIVHHRGQLSVYLRLLNVPLPGMYGPSADEK